jgi:hypothetical protein
MLFIDSNFILCLMKHIPGAVTPNVNIGIFLENRSARPFLLGKPVCQDAYHELLHNGSVLLPFGHPKVAAKVVTDLNIHDQWWPADEFFGSAIIE